MPELPEVETIRRHLVTKVVGKPITEVVTWLGRMWRNVSPAMGETLLIGQNFTGVERRGKYLLFTLESGAIAVIHLKMTGRLVYYEAEQAKEAILPRPHDRIGFYFADGSCLIFGDVRTFGGIHLYAREAEIDLKSLCQMGIEPLSRDFTGATLYGLLQKSRLGLKKFLLDQRFVAGLGNIYVDEALFLARLHPARQALSVSIEEARRLHRAIRKVLTESLAHGGTSFRDYQNAEGRRGENQKYLQVYGRQQKPCTRCHRALANMNIGGRNTVYCPHCQPLHDGNEG